MKKQQAPSDALHLGGHDFISHIDTNLLLYCKNVLDCKSMIDIGCGLGGMVYEAQLLGYEVLGIDGDYRLERKNPELFLLHDFTKGACNLNKLFDLGYSCEFVEHVEEKYIDNFLKIFANCKYIFITFAPPNTPGYHHVNCQTADYWVNKLKKYELIYDKNITQEIKKNSSMKRDFVRDNGLFFKNIKLIND